MLDLEKIHVLLTVKTDGSGVVHQAVVTDEDKARVAGDMRMRVFAERTIRAVRDPDCANLQLPPTILGQVREFTFLFRP